MFIRLFLAFCLFLIVPCLSYASQQEVFLFNNWTHCLVLSPNESFVFFRDPLFFWSGPRCILVSQHPGDPAGVYHTYRNPEHPNMLPVLDLKHVKQQSSLLSKIFVVSAIEFGKVFFQTMYDVLKPANVTLDKAVYTNLGASLMAASLLNKDPFQIIVEATGALAAAYDSMSDDVGFFQIYHPRLNKLNPVLKPLSLVTSTLALPISEISAAVLVVKNHVVPVQSGDHLKKHIKWHDDTIIDQINLFKDISLMVHEVSDTNVLNLD